MNSSIVANDHRREYEVRGFLDSKPVLPLRLSSKRWAELPVTCTELYIVSPKLNTSRLSRILPNAQLAVRAS